MQGLLIKKIAPDYPPLALQARIEGTIILNVEISKSGDVVNPSLFNGHPMLAAAALRAIGAVTKGPRLARRGPT
jgi:TonB family protein